MHCRGVVTARAPASIRCRAPDNSGPGVLGDHAMVAPAVLRGFHPPAAARAMSTSARDRGGAAVRRGAPLSAPGHGGIMIPKSRGFALAALPPFESEPGEDAPGGRGGGDGDSEWGVGGGVAPPRGSEGGPGTAADGAAWGGVGGGEAGREALDGYTDGDDDYLPSRDASDPFWAGDNPEWPRRDPAGAAGGAQGEPDYAPWASEEMGAGDSGYYDDGYGGAGGGAAGASRSAAAEPEIIPLTRDAMESLLQATGTGEQYFYYWRDVNETIQRFGLSLVGGVLLTNAAPLLAGGLALYWLWGPAAQAVRRNQPLKKYSYCGLWRAEVLAVRGDLKYSNGVVPGTRGGRTETIQLLVGDESGARMEMSAPFQREYKSIQKGDVAELVVVSNDRDLARFKAVKDVFLPRLNTWVADYPFIERQVFLDISDDVARDEGRAGRGGGRGGYGGGGGGGGGGRGGGRQEW